MSTILIIAIAIAAVFLIATLVTIARRDRQRRQLADMQTAAKRQDADHHHSVAEAKRTEAAVTEERAKRVAAEAEIHTQRATQREAEAKGR